MVNSQIRLNRQVMALFCLLVATSVTIANEASDGEGLIGGAGLNSEIAPIEIPRDCQCWQSSSDALTDGNELIQCTGPASDPRTVEYRLRTGDTISLALLAIAEESECRPVIDNESQVEDLAVLETVTPSGEIRVPRIGNVPRTA